MWWLSCQSSGLLPPPGLQSSLGARRIMGGGSSPRALKSTYASGSRRQRSYRKHGGHKMQGKHRRQRRYRRHRLGLRDQPLRLLAVSTILQREIERLHSTMRLFHIVRVGHGGYDKKHNHIHGHSSLHVVSTPRQVNPSVSEP